MGKIELIKLIRRNMKRNGHMKCIGRRKLLDGIRKRVEDKHTKRSERDEKD